MGAVKVIRKLRNLFDVTFGAPNDGDVLTYDAGTDKFILTPIAGGGPPSGPAGGVLDGTYPNPGLAASVAGSGLSEAADVLAVNVDNSTVEINADTLRIKADGITANEIAANAVSSSELADNAVDTNAIQANAVTAAKVAADVATQAELDAAIANAVNDGDAAGGVLGGTYPNPSFAVDMATQAELDAHINDAVDAHDASAISFTPHGSIAATDVQAAIQEVRDEAGTGASLTVSENGSVVDATVTVIDFLGADFDVTESPEDEVNVSISAAIARQADLDAHINDATDAHDASAISILDAANDFTATEVEGALAELQSDHEADAQALADHIADATAAHAASAISVSSATLSGTGTDVQAVFEEIDNLLDDHSSRHEDGGADEISIQGLAGTPVELTNHLNDTTDAHDASAISVLDTGGNYTGTEVEAVLAEIAPFLTTRRAMVIAATAQDGTALTTGDGKAYVGIPDLIDGYNLVAADAQLVGQSSSGNVTVQIHNVTQAADMLSTAITIQANESHSKDGTPGVPDGANDDVAYGDLLRVDIDAAGTGADGLIVVLEFETP